MKVLPTIYKKERMRSRSEARFAHWCDEHRVKWIYEPEGFAVSGVLYLPDFLLPDIKCFVEVKPLVFVGEISRMFPIIDAPEAKGWQFLVVDMSPDMRPICYWDEADGGDEDTSYAQRSACVQTQEHFEMRWCRECLQPVFAGWGSWRCRKCGAYDGKAHLSMEYPVTKKVVKRSWRTTRSERGSAAAVALGLLFWVALALVGLGILIGRAIS
jgi:hypothetical protein